MLVMLKILQARLQQYVNRELPDVQAGFRKGRGTRDQIANARWIMEKAREFQKGMPLCFLSSPSLPLGLKGPWKVEDQPRTPESTLGTDGWGNSSIPL